MADQCTGSAGGLPRKVAQLINVLGLILHPEGGFFIETYRSGSVPMTTHGQTDFKASPPNLVTMPDRKDRRPDKDPRRNCLTSIFWAPTLKSPKLPLLVNMSDHVHYYQGGLSFEYVIYDPETETLERVVMGNDILAGEKLQVPVKGGVWKAGQLLVNNEGEEKEPYYDYCLLAEAVAPGFDFYDFSWVNMEMLSSIQNSEHVDILRPFLYDDVDTAVVDHAMAATEFYEGGEKQKQLMEECM